MKKLQGRLVFIMFMEMAEVEELLCQIDSSCYGGVYYDDNDAICVFRSM